MTLATDTSIKCDFAQFLIPIFTVCSVLSLVRLCTDHLHWYTCACSLQEVIDKSSEKLKETNTNIKSLQEVPGLIQQWIKSDISELLLPSSELKRYLPIKY